MEHQISEIQVEHPSGHRLPHIAKVKLRNLTVETRAQVVRFIREYKTTYVTWAPGASPAKVIVVPCPECGSGEHLATEPGGGTEADLLDLPRF